MDETLQDLENELKRLSPRRPSADLMAALERDLGAAPRPVAQLHYSSATNWGSWKWAGWSLAGAMTAAVVMLAVFALRRPAAAPSPAATAEPPQKQLATMAAAANRYEPVQATSVLYDMREDGTALLPDKTEGRQVRYRYVDTYTWRNPTTNASLKWRVPRDEVRLVRASLD